GRANQGSCSNGLGVDEPRDEDRRNRIEGRNGGGDARLGVREREERERDAEEGPTESSSDHIRRGGAAPKCSERARHVSPCRCHHPHACAREGDADDRGGQWVDSLAERELREKVAARLSERSESARRNPHGERASEVRVLLPATA